MALLLTLVLGAHPSSANENKRFDCSIDADEYPDSVFQDAQQMFEILSSNPFCKATELAVRFRAQRQIFIIPYVLYSDNPYGIFGHVRECWKEIIGGKPTFKCRF